jgi:transposase-like protein
MAKNRKWTDAEREALIREFKRGATYDEISVLIGRSREQINATIQWLRRKGVDLPLRKNRLDVDALNKISKS